MSHYDADYFNWQKNIGAFGGVANLFKFSDLIKPDHSVIDFGSGGGFLLANMQAAEKLGIEINETARHQATENGISCVGSIEEVPDNWADRIVSNHALEHVHCPLDALAQLRTKLKPGGLAIFVVPHQSVNEEYKPSDINRHLYTWNQLTLGNLFAEAGYTVKAVQAFQHTWPPNYLEIWEQHGPDVFHSMCEKFARKSNTFQIRAVAAR